MEFTVYSEADGAILRSGRCSADDVAMQAGPGEMVLAGKALDDTKFRVDPVTGEEYLFTPSPARAELVRAVLAERERRLASGFEYDFGGARGIHRIGTTEPDRIGWDDVSDLASAMIDTGNPNGEIAIVTDTGPTVVTATEWKHVLLAAASFRQPIWAASFALQAMDPIPLDITADAYWP